MFWCQWCPGANGGLHLPPGFLESRRQEPSPPHPNQNRNRNRSTDNIDINKTLHNNQNSIDDNRSHGSSNPNRESHVCSGRDLTLTKRSNGTLSLWLQGPKPGKWSCCYILIPHDLAETQTVMVVWYTLGDSCRISIINGIIALSRHRETAAVSRTRVPVGKD